MAFYVVGVDPLVTCVEGYVQVNGTLGADPVYETPEQWGKVHLRGANLRSGNTYSVRADCQPWAPGSVLSTAVTGALWRWGDTNADGLVDFVDITRLVDGFRGVWYNLGRPCSSDAECTMVLPHKKCDLGSGYCLAITLENVDIYGSTGCTPDRQTDFTDITRGVDAFVGRAYPCPPCP